MKKKHSIIVLLMLLFLVACAPRVTIMLDGQPIPEYAYILNNPHTGLSMEVIAAKYVEKYESGESILCPVYMGVNKTYYIDPDNTIYVKIMIKIRNPNKAWYELVENVSDKPIFGKIKREILTESIYKGKLRYNSFGIFYPVADGTSRNISIEVRDKENSHIFTIGDFSYEIIEERGDANPARSM